MTVYERDGYFLPTENLLSLPPAHEIPTFWLKTRPSHINKAGNNLRNNLRWCELIMVSRFRYPDSLPQSISVLSVPVWFGMDS